MDATHFLKLANESINDRGQQYDQSQERSMGKIIAIFNICEGLELTESQGWRFMQVLKLVRSASAPEFHQDSVIDRIAYGALEAECESKVEPTKNEDFESSTWAWIKRESSGIDSECKIKKDAKTLTEECLKNWRAAKGLGEINAK